MDQEQTTIHEIIKANNDGISLKELTKFLPSSISYRTAQRRVDNLIQANMIIRRGSGPSTRYFAQNPEEQVLSVDISKAGQAIISKITKPLVDRKPAYYNREFLDRYVPNKTFYLTASDRKKLFEIGSLPKDHQPAGTLARKIYHSFLIDLSWNSSRLEGNTYSLLETERLLSQNVKAEGKSLFETQMIINHKTAIDFLLNNIEIVKFNAFTIRNLHAALSNNLLPDPGACGRLRNIPVGIGGTPYHPASVPQVVEDCFETILTKASKIKDPFEQAFFIMVHLPLLQPFEDVNKRTSRLAANIPFFQNNFMPLSFIDMPEDLYIHAILGVYELNRIELLRDVFIWNYTQSAKRYSFACQQAGEPNVFKLEQQSNIKQLILSVVQKKLDKSEAAKAIHSWAKDHLAQNIQAKFIEAVETELLKLDINSIAKFSLTPQEFKAWQMHWLA